MDFDAEVENGAAVEMAVDDDFEDLYEDVNISFQAPGSPKGEPQEQQPKAQQIQEQGLWEDDYAEAEKPGTRDDDQASDFLHRASENRCNQPPLEEKSSSPPQQQQQQPLQDPKTTASAQAPNQLPPVAAPAQSDGRTSVFISELQWWTTDAELESTLADYGKVKSVRFFEERASGKSKGLCQVDFEASQAASLCKENMHGKIFNGRACAVQFATPQMIKQMSMKMGLGAPGPQQGMMMLQNGPTNSSMGKKASSAGRGSSPSENGGGRGSKPGVGFAGRGGRGRGGGGVGNGGGRGNNEQFPMISGGYDHSSFGPPMGRPGMYGMGGGGFMGRGAYPMHYPGVPPHVNPAFFGGGMDPRSWGGGGGDAGGGWGGGEDGPEKYQEGSAEFSGDAADHGGGGGGRTTRSTRDQESSRRRERESRDRDRDRDRDGGGYSKQRETGWDKQEDDYASRKRRHSNRNEQ